MNRQEHMAPTACFVKLPCMHGQGRARMRRDWAAMHRTGRRARRAEEKQQNRAAAKTSALVAPRADALTDRTTTYSSLSARSDPSELGSEPDSWLHSRSLRAHERSGWCVREQRLGQPRTKPAEEHGQQKNHKTVPQHKLVRWWLRGPTYSRTGPQRTA